MLSTQLTLDSIDLLQGTALLEIISSRHALLTSSTGVFLTTLLLFTSLQIDSIVNQERAYSTTWYSNFRSTSSRCDIYA